MSKRADATSCPRCKSRHVVRNGDNRSGTPSYRCRSCGRRFVERPRKGPVSDEIKSRVEKLLGGGMSVRAAAYSAGVSRSWLQDYARQNNLRPERVRPPLRRAELSGDDISPEEL